MKKKYNDLELDYNLSLFSPKTVQFVKYALKDSKVAPCQYLENKFLYKFRVLRFIDMLWCYVRYGAPTHNYKSLELYKYRNSYRDTFLTSRRLTALIQKKVDIDTYLQFKNKALFNMAYSNYIRRKWMVLDENTNVEQLLVFAKSFREIIVKPIDGNMGHGIFKIDCANDGSLRSSFEKCKSSGRYICEEIVKNCNRLQEINPTSLNTIRVNTFVNKKNELVFLGMGVRFGRRGAVVDNLHSGGIIYPINIEIGQIDGCGVDEIGNKYYYHPDTNKKMIGFEIPNWDELLVYVKELSLFNTKAKLVGWDIAITNEGFEVIEANMDADEVVAQNYGIGIYSYLINNW